MAVLDSELSRWGKLVLVESFDPQLFSEFSCGNNALDHWVRYSADKDVSVSACKFYACISEAGEVLGFFTLSPTIVRSESVSRGLSGGISGEIPGYLIGRLAVRADHQGKGLGCLLLRSALAVAYNASNIAGGRLVIIDAKNEDLALWYEYHGFSRLKCNRLRLVMKMGRVKRKLRIDNF